MSAFKNQIAKRHVRVCRAIGYGLHLDCSQTWLGLAPVWEARLTKRERVALVYSVLRALSQEDQHAVFEVLFESQGTPLPPLTDHIQEAADWAYFADDEQRKATALGCFNALSPQDQNDFLSYVTTDRKAA